MDWNIFDSQHNNITNIFRLLLTSTLISFNRSSPLFILKWSTDSFISGDIDIFDCSAGTTQYERGRGQSEIRDDNLEIEKWKLSVWKREIKWEGIEAE